LTIALSDGLVFPALSVIRVVPIATNSIDEAAFVLRRRSFLVSKAIALVGLVLMTLRLSVAFEPMPDRLIVRIGTPESMASSTTWNDERDEFASKLHRGFGIRYETAAEFSSWILEASKRQRLSPELIASLVLTESSFRKDVTSSVGAIGPAQIRIEFWQRFCGTADLADPEENIYCGAQILAHYQEMCGSENCALKSYNLGFRNRNRQDFARAGERYLRKIDRHREALSDSAI